MDKISNSIKCGNCKNVLESPVLLPCGDSICKKHTINFQEPILCHACGIEHPIPAKTGFLPNKALAGIIDAKINDLDFGNEHKEAQLSCEHFDDVLTKIDNFLNDPFNFTYEAIDFLKNVVQLKGEEMIFNINETMDRFIFKLDEYKEECKNDFTKKDYIIKSEKFQVENEKARKDLDVWLATLNEIKFNEQEWKRIKCESDKAIENYEKKIINFKSDLFPRRFEQFRKEIEDEFGKFEIHPDFNLFKLEYEIELESVIIVDLSMKIQLFNLCGFDSNQLEWDLLYRGSLHGFKSSNFHEKCDNIAKTLTIIRATSGNIFGGYTEATWDQTSGNKQDNYAFLFSLVNNDNTPVKIEIANGKECEAIYCDAKYGPTFGTDLDIIDNSNITNNNVSSIGKSYVLANFPAGSVQAKSLLAGSHKFRVEEIEVFTQLYY